MASAQTAAPKTQGVETLANADQPGAEPAGDAYLFKPKTWGAQEPGKGFVVARTDRGELDVTFVTYLRYLNQTALESDLYGLFRPHDDAQTQ